MRKGKVHDYGDILKRSNRVKVKAIGGYIELVNIKHLNREAYDNNYFDLIVDDKKTRLCKDDLENGLRYV